MVFKDVVQISDEDYNNKMLLFKTLLGTDDTLMCCSERFEKIFDRISNNNAFIEYAYRYNDRDTILYAFDTGCCFKNSKERIFATMLKNYNETSTQKKFFSLTFWRETLLRSDIRDKVEKYKKLYIGDMVFDEISKMNNFLSELSRASIVENWDFKNYDSKIANPILKNYLENSYYQLFFEDKIIINNHEKKMCLNTGLMDSYFNELLLECDIHYSEDDVLFPFEFHNPLIRNGSERLFIYYLDNKQPQMASFYQKPDDLYFNWEIAQRPDGISISDQHIFEENLERINDSIADKSNRFEKNPVGISKCKQMFETTLKNSIKLAKRNFKLVAPQFWSETGTIQYLMPIYLEGKCEENAKKEISLPNVALSLEYSNGKYLGKTILTLDMAYQNARVIARPDSFWLLPERINQMKNNPDAYYYAKVRVIRNIYDPANRNYSVECEMVDYKSDVKRILYKYLFKNIEKPSEESVNRLLNNEFIAKIQGRHYSLCDVPEDIQINKHLLSEADNE